MSAPAGILYDLVRSLPALMMFAARERGTYADTIHDRLQERRLNEAHHALIGEPLTTESALQALAPFFRDAGPCEVFVALAVNRRGELTSFRQPGEVDRVDLDQEALHEWIDESRAITCIVAHHHPSGDPWPSHEDRELTVALQASRPAIFDHLVFGRPKRGQLARAFSIAEDRVLVVRDLGEETIEEHRMAAEPRRGRR